MSIPIQTHELVEIFNKVKDSGMIMLYKSTRMREPVYWHTVKNINVNSNYISFSYISENQYGGWGDISLVTCSAFITDTNLLEVKTGKCTVQRFKIFNEPVNLHTLI